MNAFDVLIVGGGHAGAQAAIALRQASFAGSIGIVGDEPDFPYERPPLSKDYLAGKRDFARILIRPEVFWQERHVGFVLGEQVSLVEPTGRKIRTASGRELSYGILIWAAGGQPRRLACGGSELDGVHAIRSRADVDRLVLELSAAHSVLIAGAGYIGLEAAAVLREMGKQVTVIEAQDRVLARVAGPILSAFYQVEHRARGVDIRLGVTLQSLSGQERVERAHLSSGEVIATDIVVVGIGIAPAVGPLMGVGLATRDGVPVDENCQTTDPHIYAVGDCAWHLSRWCDYATRIESVQNANDQATTAALAILGTPKPYRAVPWFWSNQYDLKLQTVGLSARHDEAVLRGRTEDRSFSVVYLKHGKVAALDCVNAVKDYVQGRKLVEANLSVSSAALADTSTPLKDLLKEAA